MQIKSYLAVFLLLFSACSTEPSADAPDLSNNKEEKSTYTPPFDNFQAPVQVPAGTPAAVEAGKPIVVKAGKPTEIAVNTNIRKVAKLTTRVCGQPLVSSTRIPGILPPTRTASRGLEVSALQPNPVLAFPPHAKDDVINHIEYLDMDQGMNTNNINILFEDKIGNLWMGTKSNGLIKYDGKTFLFFTEKEGLSSNNISSIIEDIRGNIWIGTLGGGANRYDGKTFTHFTTKQGLSNNSVTSLLEDTEGNIWIGTNGGGVNKYDGESLIIYTNKNGLNDNIILSMIEDSKGNIWFGTLYGGADKYDGKSFYHYTESEGLRNNWVSTMLEDKKGNIWFGHRMGGADKLDANGFTYISMEDGLSSNVIVDIKEDKENNIWFATQNAGINKYDGVNIIQYREAEGLNDNFINCIHNDKFGNIWIGTNSGGVNILKVHSFVHYTLNDGLTDDKVLSITQDTANNIWFATWKGVSKYNGKSFLNYTETEGLGSNHINTVFADSKGNVWFGTSDRGVTKYDGKSFSTYTEKQGLSNYCVTSIAEDLTGNLWLATQGVGVDRFDGKSFYHYTDKDGLSSNYVTVIFNDKNNNLWFGTQTGGICKYDGKTFTRFSKKQGLVSNKLSSITEDKQGNLWFGTNGDGLIKFDGINFINFTEDEGLSNNIVSAVFKDKEGKVWVSTDKGINIISNNEINSNKLHAPYEVLTKSEGLKDNRFNLQSVLFDKQGNAWWGSYKSASMLDLNKYEYPQYPPTIQLNSIELDQNFIDFNWLKDTLKKGGKITIGDSKNKKELDGIRFREVAPFHNYPVNPDFPYYLNNLTFRFSAIDWQAPHKLRYVYMLEGLDKGWSPLTSETMVNYRNLPYGKFTFKVNAVGVAGKFCKGFEYSFSIRSPWWLRWWFRVLVAIAVMVFLFYVLHWRTGFLRRRQVVLQRIIRERTEDVVQQKMEVEQRNEIIEVKQKEILASINYAQRIQRSLLPPIIEIMDAIPNSFIMFKPKDIVSGDFYWFSESENKMLIAAADCTGHGVPGAFMSAICSEKLNEAVTQTDDVSSILQIVNIRMKKVLRQYGKEDLTHDGMDIALCAFDMQTNEVEFAGANRPLWIIRHGATELEEIQADKVSIGGFTDNNQLFTLHKLNLNKGDTVYLFTDGFPDQFGVNDKKLLTKKFRELLLSIQDKSMGEQKTHLDFFIEKWKGDTEQTDDILVVGIRM